MGVALVLALAPGESPEPTVSESWVTPDLLGRAQADDAIDLQDVCDLATSILYRLSGRQFGVRTETIRPVAGQRSIGWSQYFLTQGYDSDATLIDTSSVNINIGPDFLYLSGPVQSITSVKIDGVTLDPSEYVLYDSRKLVRVSDTPWWPLNQDLSVPDTAAGSFSITYSWGHPVPNEGKLVAQAFAIELGKYFNGEPCALPDRVISLTRQGVSQTIADPSQLLSNMRTGLYAVDAWLMAVNPRGQRRRATITSPESILKVRAT